MNEEEDVAERVREVMLQCKLGGVVCGQLTALCILFLYLLLSALIVACTVFHHELHEYTAYSVVAFGAIMIVHWALMVRMLALYSLPEARRLWTERERGQWSRLDRVSVVHLICIMFFMFDFFLGGCGARTIVASILLLIAFVLEIDLHLFSLNPNAGILYSSPQTQCLFSSFMQRFTAT
jgi:hypothetical protein